MDTQKKPSDNPSTAIAEIGFVDEFRQVWRRIPGKLTFLLLLAAWLLLFHFWGNGTFGYVKTNSLLKWMHIAYTVDSPFADDGHGILIPFIVLILLWWRRADFQKLPVTTWWPAAVLVLMALVMHVLG